jgi:hypothetical protein
MIHSPNIVHETVGNETIVVHLDTGNYYSLTGSGAEIWTMVNGAASVAAICAELGRRYERAEDDIRDDVETFVADLEGEDLIEDGEAAPNGMPAPTASAAGAWEPPKLERFDDMRHFLLVDPIHEVDATGWPNQTVAKA